MIVVLDTNALVWAFEGSKSLGRRAEQAIDDAVTGGTAHVSAISFWELALKIRKKKFGLSRSILDWRSEVLRLGVREFPVDGRIGIEANELPNIHDDPVQKMTAVGLRLDMLAAERTDLAAAIRLGTAAFPESGQKRLVLMTDGNENAGDAMAAILAAKPLGVTVDVVPMGVSRANSLSWRFSRHGRTRCASGSPPSGARPFAPRGSWPPWRRIPMSRVCSPRRSHTKSRGTW